MTKARFYSSEGDYKSDIDLPDSHFNQPANMAIIHLAVDIYSGNQRQGTSKTKSRGEVSGSGRKPWKQKGTGRARSGTNTSPVWVRGGKAHGAEPRDYRRKINAKTRRKALLSALSIKANDSNIHVFENFKLEAPKTKALTDILSKASLESRKMTIYTASPDANLFLAARNIPSLKVGRVEDINTYEVINSQELVFTQGAIDGFTGTKGQES